MDTKAYVQHVVIPSAHAADSDALVIRAVKSDLVMRVCVR
jgi:hypothetical protein